MKTFFFVEHLRLCPWSLALASSIPVLGLESVCLSSERLSLALASAFFCVLGLGLEPCVLDSTSVIYRTIAISVGVKLNDHDQPVGQVVNHSSLKQEVKSRASQIRQWCQWLATTASCNISLKIAVLLGAMMRRWAPANSLHAAA